MSNYYEQMYPAPERPGGSRPARRRRRAALAVLAVLILAAGLLAFRMVKGALTQTIDVISVQGAISSAAPGPFDSVSYDHAFLLGAIDRLIYDGSNRALVLYVDSPGGGVYETDELYLKLMEYKEKTGRPIYASFASQAASGGYYAAMSADKIFCNRNCMTGSIGVRLNTVMDMTEFMKKLGIRTENITSGKNKAMGDPYSALTDEQRAIMQSYVDDAYEQFISVVADGRGNLTLDEVRALSDGRIYSARQALDNGLVDAIGSLDDAVRALQNDYGLEDSVVRHARRGSGAGFWESLFARAAGAREKNEVESYVDLYLEMQRRSGYYCAAMG